jgi:CheY-like chemotaxis protein
MKDEPIRILLVDDDAPFVFLLKRALGAEHFRYELITLSDGAEALAFIRKQRKSGRRQPALIVMDLHLPKEDGIEILKELRWSAAFSDVPVAILSSSVSPEERNRVAAFEDTSFITKPNDLDAFLNVGRRIKENGFGKDGLSRASYLFSSPPAVNTRNAPATDERVDRDRKQQ